MAAALPLERRGTKRSPFLWKLRTARMIVAVATPETFDTSFQDMICWRKSVVDPYLSCTSASTWAAHMWPRWIRLTGAAGSFTMWLLSFSGGLSEADSCSQNTQRQRRQGDGDGGRLRNKKEGGEGGRRLRIAEGGNGGGAWRLLLLPIKRAGKCKIYN